jgi:hypothetical protein
MSATEHGTIRSSGFQADLYFERLPPVEKLRTVIRVGNVGASGRAAEKTARGTQSPELAHRRQASKVNF